MADNNLVYIIDYLKGPAENKLAHTSQYGYSVKLWGTYYDNLDKKTIDSFVLSGQLGRLSINEAHLNEIGYTKILPEDRTGTVEITSTPSNAKITISGKTGTWLTPSTINLTVGDYLMKINLAAHAEETQNFTIRSGESIKFDFALEFIQPEKPDVPEEPPEVDPEEPPQKTLWEMVIEAIPDPLLLLMLTSEEAFRLAFKTLVGKEFDLEEWKILAPQIADYVLPLNVISKLFFGKNIKGESDEFGSAEDWIDSILTLAAVVPVGKVTGTAGKFAIKKITTTEAAKLVEKFGAAATVTKLLAIARKHPETSAKFLSKFPLEVREAVIKGLGKTKYGREVIYALGETGYWKLVAPIWKKIMRILGKIGTGLIAVTLPIFAVTEIPNYLNFRKLARKNMMQEQGTWPTDISFQLDNYEDALKTAAFDVDRDIKENRFESARAKLDLMKNTFTDYKDYNEARKGDMLPEDYDLAEDLILWYETFISDREPRLAGIPEPTPPEEPPEEPPTTPPGTEEPDPENVPPVGKSFITIDSNPRGAAIWLDGENTYTSTPFAHLLDSGVHNVQLQLFRHLPTFETVTLVANKAIIKTYSIEPLVPEDPESPFIPVPIEISLEKPVEIPVEPNAWEYTITARDSDTGQVLNAKIIIDGIFTGDYTTNTVVLEPEAEYKLRLEAFGYEPAEVIITTEKLP